MDNKFVGYTTYKYQGVDVTKEQYEQFMQFEAHRVQDMNKSLLALHDCMREHRLSIHSIYNSRNLVVLGRYHKSLLKGTAITPDYIMHILTNEN